MECLNRNSFIKLLLSTSVLAVFLTSCYYDNKEELLQNIEGAGCDSSDLTYDAKIGSILDASCAISGCHDSNTKENGYDFSQYSTTSTAVTSGRLAAVLSSGSMPKSPGTITACDKQNVIKWINNGAPQN